MAIIPISHDAGGVEVHHAEFDHSGTLPWSAVRFGPRPGTREDDRSVLLLACPVAGCGGETAHPVGEASPDLVRQVAAELATRVPEGPRPPTAEEEAAETERADRAGLLAQVDAAIAGWQDATALVRQSHVLLLLRIVRALGRRMG